MTHVDDILFVRFRSFWNDVFLKKMKERFSVSQDELKGAGSSSITLLRRKIIEVDDGLVWPLGRQWKKYVVLVNPFGPARLQKLPNDASLQSTVARQLTEAFQW